MNAKSINIKLKSILKNFDKAEKEKEKFYKDYDRQVLFKKKL